MVYIGLKGTVLAADSRLLLQPFCLCPIRCSVTNEKAASGPKQSGRESASDGTVVIRAWFQVRFLLLLTCYSVAK